MGSGRWDPNQWSNYSTQNVAGRSQAQVQNRSGMKDPYNPSKIKGGVRESRDSQDNPLSTAVIVGGDVTGSMGDIAFHILKEGLNTFATEVYNRRPVTDPHLMFMAVGDAHTDRAPFQVTQFEADIRIAEQLQDLFIEGNGGGNGSESYHIPWYFAAAQTSIDCFERRGQKGVLFTYGDEGVPPAFTPEQAERIFGQRIERALSADELLVMAQRTYDVYHLVIAQGSGYRQYDNVLGQWRKLLGERAILVEDYTTLTELMVSILQVTRQGMSAAQVAQTWSGNTAVAVRSALDSLERTQQGSGTDLVQL